MRELDITFSRSPKEYIKYDKRYRSLGFLKNICIYFFKKDILIFLKYVLIFLKNVIGV